MCGRYTITTEQKYLEQRFKAKFVEPYRIRFNAAPSQYMPIIKNSNKKVVSFLRWGIRPSWMEKIDIKKDGLINVRAENLKEKRTFGGDLKNRRCLVLADGFIEWNNIQGAKSPYRIILKKEKPFAMAGIWECDTMKDGRKVECFAIVTTQANGLVSKIHNRMPVILSESEEKVWLNNDLEKGDWLNILDPYQMDNMRMYQINKLVNNPQNDMPEVLEMVA